MTDKFFESLPHGQFNEVFKDIWIVTGTMKMKPVFQFSRNMIVLKQGNELTLVNSVRLDEEGLQQLDALGSVKYVVKLGHFHGVDDPFYVDRYQAQYWALSTHKCDNGLTPSNFLDKDKLPWDGITVWNFKTSKFAEAILCIEREGGVIISCDALQNWHKTDRYFNFISKIFMRFMGFIKPTNLGPGWLKFSEPKKSDFEELLSLKFNHVLGAHGAPVIGDALEKYSKRINALRLN